MKSWKRKLCLMAGGGAVLSITGWLGFQLMLHHQPSFYQEAIALKEGDLDAAGIEFEKTLLAVHNDLRRGQAWEADWEQTQVNGWLAADLPQKLPHLLPDEIQDPRVAFRASELSVGFRYRKDPWDVVVSATLRVRLTNEPNQLAIRVNALRAGALPAPMGRWVDRISKAFRQQGIRIRWIEENGRPVALVTVSPPVPDNKQQEAVIEQLQLANGRLRLAGHRRERE